MNRGYRWLAPVAALVLLGSCGNTPTQQPPAGSAWCEHVRLIRQITGKDLNDGLPLLLQAADGLAQDAQEFRAVGRAAEPEAIEAAVARLRKSAEILKSQGYTAILTVFLENAGFGVNVPPTQVETAREEFLSMPGVESAEWSPNILTVKLSVFMSYHQIYVLRDLDSVEGALPGDVGPDPVPAALLEAMTDSLRDLPCNPPLASPFDPPFLP